MKNQHIFHMNGLTCKNCAAKVKRTLIEQGITADISDDLNKINLLGENLDIENLNIQLKKVGNYEIGSEIELRVLRNIIQSDANTTKNESLVTSLNTYKPLALVLAYILLVTLTIETAQGSFVLHRWMPNFMAGFFLVFSFFKLLDLRGFASSYAMYDLAAKRFFTYGLMYPFIELGLGVWYLLAPSSITLNWLAFFVMNFSAIGVILAVRNKQKIKCACLGTGFNLPMTTVTIVEDVLMAAMALWMLI